MKSVFADNDICVIRDKLKLQNILLTLAWKIKNAQKQHKKLYDKHIILKELCKDHGISPTGGWKDPKTITKNYVDKKILKCARYLEGIAQFFGRQCGNQFVVARSFVKKHMQLDQTLYDELFEKFIEKFAKMTDAQINNHRNDADVVLRRAISGVLASQSCRQAFRLRKAVCY